MADPSLPVPALSIVLPVFDGARYLAAQVDSILAQSDPDFELLAIDDGSRDDGPAILADYAQRDRRVRILPSTGNRGQKRRLQELLAEARGAYFAIADQDDVWHPERNARLRAAIGDRALAFGPSRLIDGNGAPLGTTLLDALGLEADAGGRARILFEPMVSAHAALVRRDWFDPTTLAHPLPFDWLMSALALLGPGLAYVPEAVVEHRIHDSNQMNRAGPDTSRPLAGLRNRLNFLALGPQRLRLWLMLDFLGQSTVPDARRFAELATACRTAWFGVPRAPYWEDRALRERLIAQVAALAGGDAERRFVQGRIDLLTRTRLHPSTLRTAVARLRG